MSQYTDYNSVSETYDDGRVPIAADVLAPLLKSLVNQKVPSILDAGCGTANYLETFVKHGYKNITLMDASPGMISKASEKAKMLQARQPDLNINFKIANITKLPFEDNTFDIIMVNLVIHHLETSPDGIHYPKISLMISEFHRILRPGGIVSIMTLTPDQQRAVWYGHLLPKALERYLMFLPDTKTLHRIITENNLTLESQISYMGPVHWIKDYDNPDKVFDEHWRTLDSLWSMPSGDEIKDFEDLIRTLKSKNKLHQFYKEHDQKDKYGLTTIFVSRKNK